ncbi:hypothetical protein EDB19DRAFT_988321 [Suillus lakei]|nr:hypothetical protein EDB19DRAFT_988321 [Suillus lakei]
MRVHALQISDQYLLQLVCYSSKKPPPLCICLQRYLLFSIKPGTDIAPSIMLISAIQALDGCISSTNSLVIRPPSSHSVKFPLRQVPTPSNPSSTYMTLISNDPTWWPTINSYKIYSYFLVESYRILTLPMSSSNLECSFVVAASDRRYPSRAIEMASISQITLHLGLCTTKFSIGFHWIKRRGVGAWTLAAVWLGILPPSALLSSPVI